jgi:hypothetical protein
LIEKSSLKRYHEHPYFRRLLISQFTQKIRKINSAIERIQLLEQMDDPISIIEEVYAKQIEQGIYSVFLTECSSTDSDILKNLRTNGKTDEENICRRLYTCNWYNVVPLKVYYKI